MQTKTLELIFPCVDRITAGSKFLNPLSFLYELTCIANEALGSKGVALQLVVGTLLQLKLHY